MHTILAALDEACDYKRERAECCADCADQSCTTCQYRLETARAYESLAVRLMRAMETAAEKPLAQPADGARGLQPQATADRDAGQ